MRRAGESIKLVQDGKWPQTPWSPFLLTGPALSRPNLTIGFLGFGRISHCTLQRLLAFTKTPGTEGPPRCIYTSSRVREDQGEIDNGLTKRFGVEVRRVEKEVLARESDVLIVLCSLNEETKGMVNEEFLGLMKRDSVLINVARVSLILSLCNLLIFRIRDPSSTRTPLLKLSGTPRSSRRAWT
jgi:glyoxylate/hydroxypyruvate reductase